MLRKLALPLSAAALVAVSIPAGADTKVVTIPDLSFQPAKARIFVGDTVRWVNQDNRRHSVTANSSSVAQGESFSSGNCTGGFLFNNCMRRGDTFEHRFTKPGTFTYRCNIHGSDTSFAQCAMCGQVIVTEHATATPTTPGTATPTFTGSPTSTASPTTTASATPTGTVTSPGGPRASGPSDIGTGPVLAIAAIAVLLLGGSGLVVYRTYLRR